MKETFITGIIRTFLIITLTSVGCSFQSQPTCKVVTPYNVYTLTDTYPEATLSFASGQPDTVGKYTELSVYIDSLQDRDMYQFALDSHQCSDSSHATCDENCTCDSMNCISHLLTTTDHEY